jgi:hypothetical protein
MLRRVLAICDTRLLSQVGGERVPFAALLAQGSLMGAVCLFVRGDLGPWGYGVFVLSASCALVAMILLGEFGSLLRADSTAEWSECLPASSFERRLGHGLAVLVLLCSLALGVLVPAALLAPEALSLAGRGALLAAGLGQAIFLGAGLLTFQVVLGDRAEALLVLLQTLLVVCAVAGLLRAPVMAQELALIEAGGSPWPTWFNWMPPIWYASLVDAAPAGAALPRGLYVVLASLAAVLLFVVLSPAQANRGRRSTTLLARILAPARALAARFWVRPRERAVFDLVYDAMPLEREFVLRTYPMVGMPLAFLVAGTRGAGGQGLEDLLALLLFTPAVYLPVLLAHVPVTSSPEARWLMETAPVTENEVRSGAIKALFVRFILPLYLVLGLLACYLAGFSFSLRLCLPAALVSLLSLRLLYPRCVMGAPLSVAPADILVHHDWTGLLITLAAGLTVLALVVQRVLVTPAETLALVGLLVFLEFVLEKRAART